MKISLIGAGNIGSTLAQMLVPESICTELFLCDISKNVHGIGLDLKQSIPNFNSSIKISTSSELHGIEQSDVIVVTAGVPRKDGMTREDVLNVNAEVIAKIGEQIKHHAKKDVFVIVVTNPLDAMTWLMLKKTELPKRNVVGMAGALDAARCKLFISEKLNVKPSDIELLVFGGHGDLMTVSHDYISVGGVLISHWIKSGAISKNDLQDIIQRTRMGGGEIISKAGRSAYFATASSILLMLKAYAMDANKVICCATHVDNAYGMQNYIAGVPCIIGRNGVSNILDLPLSNDDHTSFTMSVKKVQESIDCINDI